MERTNNASEKKYVESRRSNNPTIVSRSAISASRRLSKQTFNLKISQDRPIETKAAEIINSST